MLHIRKSISLQGLKHVPTLVCFRRIKRSHIIVALFPQQIGARHGRCGCYVNGTFSDCDGCHTLKTTVAATPEEYEAVKQMLEAHPLSYELNVMGKMPIGTKSSFWWWRDAKLMQEYLNG
jgi:hypothetical protein